MVVRSARELTDIDRLIIPGGESTVMRKFLLELQMQAPLLARMDAGMPVWGVCAGAILLAETIDGRQGPLAALPITIARNAFGRQAASRIHPIDIPLFDLTDYPALFIRAPRIAALDASVRVLARRGDDPVFIQKERVIATTFHPELNQSDCFHRFFLTL